MTGDDPLRVVPIGERALLVIVGDRLDHDINTRSRRLAAALDGAFGADPRFSRSVPAAASVLVRFDPLLVDPDEARRLVNAIAAESGTAGPIGSGAAEDRRPIEIAVRYGGSDGPDLEAVAEFHGVSVGDIVELHCGSSWTVLFLGFAPGFAYLGPLPSELATPRRATPRERVPGGSVAIGGEQTAVYPFDLPGGWHLIGRTDTRMWQLGRPQPNLVGPGDLVRFVPLR
jgi:KipI family sensor histidine kinase inhibitor